jgi:hypothetical protein
MYFGEVFEPRHLCPNDSCGCGHRRLEHEQASARELELPVKTGVSTTHRSSAVVRALSQDDIESRY